MKPKFLATAIMASALFAAALPPSGAYAADIDLSTLHLNNGATATANDLNVGNGDGFTSMSAFVPTPYATEGLSFSGSFKLNLSRVGDSAMQADGASFIIQNDGAGVNAHGGEGGNIGAYYLANALGIGFQSWSNDAAFIFTTDTFRPVSEATQNENGGNGNFSLGANPTNLISVAFSYANDVFSFTATNASTTQSISKSLNFDLTDLGQKVFIGFTGGTGGASAYQNISDFKLETSYTPTAVPGPEAGAGLGALAMGGMAMWMVRRRKADDQRA